MKRVALASALSLTGILSLAVACSGDEPNETCVGAGCNVAPPSSNGEGGTPPPADGAFTIDALPDTTLVASSSAQLEVKVTRNGFTGPITLAIEGAPLGVTATGTTILAGATSNLLPLSAAESATEGRAVIRVVATDSAGGKKQTADLKLLVRGKPFALDTSFGTGTGFVEVPGGSNNILAGVVVQPDGFATVGGTIDKDFSVFRLDRAGVLDGNFGTGGHAATDFRTSGSATDDTLFGMRLQSDGKLLLSGYSKQTTDLGTFYSVARLDGTGHLDGTFDDDGQLLTAYLPDTERNGDLLAWDVAYTADARPLITGTILLNGSNPLYDGYDHVIVSRFGVLGGVDEGWANGTGFATSPNVGESTRCYSLDVAPNGRIACGGYIQNGGGHDPLLYFLKPDGLTDDTVSATGIVTSSTGDSSELSTIRWQADETIFGAGQTGATKVGLYHYSKLGTVVGSVQFDGFGPSPIEYGGMAFDSAGRIYVAAMRETDPTHHTLVVARFSRELILDTTFANAGILEVTGATAFDNLVRIAISNDDQLVLATTRAASTPVFAVYRYWL